MDTSVIRDSIHMQNGTMFVMNPFGMNGMVQLLDAVVAHMTRDLSEITGIPAEFIIEDYIHCNTTGIFDKQFPKDRTSWALSVAKNMICHQTERCEHRNEDSENGECIARDTESEIGENDMS